MALERGSYNLSMNETRDALRAAASVLNESRSARNLMDAFPKTVQLELRGEGQALHIGFAGGRMAVGEGAAPDPDIVVTGDAQEFTRVVNGSYDISHPIARGKLRVQKGKVSDMTLLNRILWARKRGGAA